jgi:golgi-specific brefeldin A-resistance guanine nucleotide exchange factor 1
MSRDVTVTDSIVLLAADVPPTRRAAQSSRMQYRSRPVTVAVDPISLVISECITITSAIQKYARSAHSSVSAILGGSPNLVQLGAPSSHRLKGPGARGAKGGEANGEEPGPSNRWGLRGKKGKSMQDNPLIAGFGRLRQELTGVKGELVPGWQAGRQAGSQRCSY